MQEIDGLIEQQETIHMENVANQAFDSQASDFGAAGGQPLAHPDQDVMSQGFQLDQDLLRFEAFFVALAGSQALLIFFDLDLHAPTALVVEVYISQQNRFGIVSFGLVTARQEQHLFSRQGGEDHAIAPLTISLAAAYGNPFHWSAVQVG